MGSLDDVVRSVFAIVVAIAKSRAKGQSPPGPPDIRRPPGGGELHRHRRAFRAGCFAIRQPGGKAMRILRLPLSGAVLIGALGPTALATPLTVVDVNAPAVNCLFAASCKVTVTDTLGSYPPKPGYSGKPRLQSRTFVGKPGTAGAGKTAYLYRVDFSAAKPVADQNCAIDLKVDIGPISKLPYNNGAPADIFVVTSGGIGTVGLASADQTGNVVTFTFTASPLPVCPQQSSFFFGLAAEGKPHSVTAQSDLNFGGGTVNVAARAPKH